MSDPTIPIALQVGDDDVPHAESRLGVQGIDPKLLVTDAEGGYFEIGD